MSPAQGSLDKWADSKNFTGTSISKKRSVHKETDFIDRAVVAG